MKSKRRGLGGVAGAGFTGGGLVVVTFAVTDVEQISRVLELILEVVSLDLEPPPPPPLPVVIAGAVLFRRGMLRSSWRSCSL